MKTFFRFSIFLVLTLLESSAMDRLLVNGIPRGGIPAYYPQPQQSYYSFQPVYTIPQPYAPVSLAPASDLFQQPTTMPLAHELNLAEMCNFIYGISFIVPYLQEDTDLLCLSKIPNLQGEKGIDAIATLCTKPDLFSLRTIKVPQEGGGVSQEAALQITSPKAIIDAWNNLEQTVENVKLMKNISGNLQVQEIHSSSEELREERLGEAFAPQHDPSLPSRKPLLFQKRKRSIGGSKEKKLEQRPAPKRLKKHNQKSILRTTKSNITDSNPEAGTFLLSEENETTESSGSEYSEGNDRKANTKQHHGKKSRIAREKGIRSDLAEEEHLLPEDEQDVLSVSAKLITVSTEVEKGGLYLFVFLKTLIDQQHIKDREGLSSVVGEAYAVTSREMSSVAKNWLGLDCEAIVFKSFFQRLNKQAYKKLKGIARIKGNPGIKYYIENVKSLDKLCAYLKGLEERCQQIESDKRNLLIFNVDNTKTTGAAALKNLQNLESLILEQLHIFRKSYL